METIVSGFVLPCGTGVEPEPTFIDGLETLKRIVGGNIDVVTTTMNQDDVVIVGYVNDEFLMLDLDYNYLATALFGREIYGDVAIVWGLDKDGNYDGDNHDMPTSVSRFIQTSLVEAVANAYGKSAIMSIFCDIAITAGLADEEEVNYRSEQLALASMNGMSGTAESDEHVNFFIALIDMVVKYAETDDCFTLDPEVMAWAETMIEELQFQKGE